MDPLPTPMSEKDAAVPTDPANCPNLPTKERLLSANSFALSVRRGDSISQLESHGNVPSCVLCWSAPSKHLSPVPLDPDAGPCHATAIPRYCFNRSGRNVKKIRTKSPAAATKSLPLSFDPPISAHRIKGNS